MEKSLLLSNIGEETSMYYSFNNSTTSSIITIDDDEMDDNEKTLEASSSSEYIEITSSIEMENPFESKNIGNKINRIKNNSTSTPTQYFSPLQLNPANKKNSVPLMKEVKKILNSIENNLNLEDDPNDMINDLNNKFEKIKLARSSAGENNIDMTNKFSNNLENESTNSVESSDSSKNLQFTDMTLSANDQISSNIVELPTNGKKLKFANIDQKSSLNNINKSSKQLDNLNKNSKKHSILNFDSIKKSNDKNNFLINKQTNQSEIKQIKNFSELQKTFLKPILKKPTFELASKMKIKSNNSNLSQENSASDSLSSTTTITNANNAAAQNKLFIKKRQTINAQYTFAPKRRSTNPSSTASTIHSRLTAGGINSRVSSIVKTTLNSPKIKKIISNNKKQTDIINKKQPLRQTISGADFVRKECPVCFKKFLPTFYEKHVKSHRKNDSIIPGDASQCTKNKCKYCDKTFAINKALINHLSENCIKIPLHEKKKILTSNYSSLKLLKAGNQSNESLNDSQVNMKKIQKLLPFTDRLKPIITKKKPKKNIKKNDGAHSGVFTPRKTLCCYLCKIKFNDLMQYTDHNMKMHANSVSVGGKN